MSSPEFVFNTSILEFYRNIPILTSCWDAETFFPPPVNWSIIRTDFSLSAAWSGFFWQSSCFHLAAKPGEQIPPGGLVWLLKQNNFSLFVLPLACSQLNISSSLLLWQIPRAEQIPGLSVVRLPWGSTAPEPTFLNHPLHQQNKSSWNSSCSLLLCPKEYITKTRNTKKNKVPLCQWNENLLWCQFLPQLSPTHPLPPTDKTKPSIIQWLFSPKIHFLCQEIRAGLSTFCRWTEPPPQGNFLEEAKSKSVCRGLISLQRPSAPRLQITFIY